MRLPFANRARLRLASGLVLFSFAATHLINHVLGIHSLAAMEAGGHLFVAIWRSAPGSALLYGAFATHIGLALFRLWRRRSLKLPPWELAQLGLGLAIPFLLVVHVIGTRGLHSVHGVDDDYAYVLDVLWPDGAWRQSLMLLVVWLHGCIGLHFWLRLRAWYDRATPWLFAAALLLPTLSLIGFVTAGRELRALAALDPAWLAARAEAGAWPDAAETAWVYRMEDGVLIAFAAVLATVLAARWARALRARRAGQIRLAYPNGVTVAIAPGMSVLEASRSAGIPHASVCGGRGRCSTCRVRVGELAGRLPAPEGDEARVLERIGAPADVRLACQLRPLGDLSVVPLLPAGASARDVHVQVDPTQGVEREIAVLFADLRAFTRLAEGRLPYDTVFILNQWFRAMGTAIEGAGGRVDKFVGDGLMAWFGFEAPPDAACRQALAGARAMALALDVLNRELAHELREPLRIAIGLHAGPVIIGEMGYRGTSSLTAIGDTVNVASRLEALAKTLDAQLVVSARLAERAGVDLSSHELKETEIRGRQRPLRLRVVPRAKDLPAGLTAGFAADPPGLGWSGMRRLRRGGATFRS